MPVRPIPRARGAQTLEISPGNSMGERMAMAWRDLRETTTLWRLCWTLAALDIKLRYRGSMLGPFWLTLSTGVMVAAMGTIYATLFKIEMHNYLPFLAVSQVLWGFLAVLVTDACNGYTTNESMIRSVRMPFTLYAARMVLRNVLILAHNLVVIAVVDLVMWNWPGPEVVLVVPGFAVWLVDGLAISLLLGAVCARFRDIPPIVASVMQMAFFVTPVIWKPQLIGDMQWMLPYNPFYTLLEIVRAPLLGEVPGGDVYLSAAVSSVLLCGLSWLLFARVRGRIAFWV
jgi:lipopolysaccharide transport system permease protein